MTVRLYIVNTGSKSNFSRARRYWKPIKETEKTIEKYNISSIHVLKAELKLQDGCFPIVLMIHPIRTKNIFLMNCASCQYFIKIKVHRDADIHRLVNGIEILILTILIRFSRRLGWLLRLMEMFGQSVGNLVRIKIWLSPCYRQRCFLVTYDVAHDVKLTGE